MDNDESKIGKNPKKLGDYLLYKELGKGSYGVVYLAKHKDNKHSYIALKRYFRNLHPNIVILEILILNKYTDESILKIKDGFVDNYEIFFISPYKKNKNFNDYFKSLSIDQIRLYMFKLLRCLESIHKIGIVHRDIKPTNFIFDPDDGSCLLLDFGLSECIYNDMKSVPESLKDDLALSEIINFQNHIGYGKGRIGTRGFLAPEVIFQAKNQTQAVDIWATGIILLGFLSHRMPVLNLNKFSKITDETLKELVPLIIMYGSEKIVETAKSFDSNIYITSQMETLYHSGGFNYLFKRPDVDYEIIDLLNNLLELDPAKRFTATQALNHSFFICLSETKEKKL